MMMMRRILRMKTNGLLLAGLMTILKFESVESWTPLTPPLAVRQRQRHTVSTTALYHQHQRHHEHISEEHGVSPLNNKKADTNERLSSSRLPSRREWFTRILTQTTAASSLVATVLSSTAMSASAAVNVVTTAAVCDSSVSVWQLPAAITATASAASLAIAEDETVVVMDRLVYLLGTAHISEVSAQLAGQLVRDTHPNAVFVELDLKRVGGAVLAKSNKPPALTTTSRRIDINAGESSSSKIVIPAISYSPVPSPTPLAASAAALASTVTTAQEDGMVTAILPVAAPAPPLSPPLQPPQPQGMGFSFRQGVLNMGAAAVGNAIRSMYKNLDDAGFKPGDEFAMAIQSGRDINADIVLGDQDVEITLRRLTQALAATDLNKLMDPDSDLERSMRQLMGGSGDSTDVPNPLSLPGMTDGRTPVSNAEFKRDLSAYIEIIKTRESVRRIMSQLNEVAPALVQVMLTERDAYMAAGLDTLNQYEVITAVVGVAHQDGIEANLRQRGWKQVALKCPSRR
jgi:hypothetical protein